MIVVQLRVHVAAELQQARPDVARPGAGPLQLRQRPGRLLTPDLQLKEPVACRVVPLGQEQVVFAPGVDVGDPPPIAQDLHRLLQPGDRQLLLAAPGYRRRRRNNGQQDPQPRPSPRVPTSIVHRERPSIPDHGRRPLFLVYGGAQRFSITNTNIEPYLAGRDAIRHFECETRTAGTAKGVQRPEFLDRRRPAIIEFDDR